MEKVLEQLQQRAEKILAQEEEIEMLKVRNQQLEERFEKEITSLKLTGLSQLNIFLKSHFAFYR